MRIAASRDPKVREEVKETINKVKQVGEQREGVVSVMDEIIQVARAVTGRIQDGIRKL